MPGLIYKTMCPNCAEKLQARYWVEPVEGTERGGLCALCWQHSRLMQYEIEPRRRPAYRKQSGAGERARASR